MGPLIRDINYKSPTYGQMIANPSFVPEKNVDTGTMSGLPTNIKDVTGAGSLVPSGSPVGILSSENGVENITKAQDKLKQLSIGLSQGTIKTQGDVNTLYEKTEKPKTQQEQDRLSGTTWRFGYGVEGQRNDNPNTDANSFSPEELEEAGITDPLKEGLIFDPSRNVYTVGMDKTTPSSLSSMRGLQTQEKEASDALVEEEDWVLSQMKSAINGADSMLVDTLNNIQADYQNRKAQLEQANKRNLSQLATTGYRYGTARYAPEVNNTLLSAEERAGIQKLSDLATETQSLIIKAKQAAQSEKFDMLYKYMGEIDKKMEEQAKAAEALAKAKVDQDKAIADKAKAQQDAQKVAREQEEYDAENLAYSLYGSDLTSEELSTIAEVSGISPQSLMAARQRVDFEQSKQNATVGDLKEYQQALSSGIIPEGTSFFSYLAQKGAAGRKADAGMDGVGGIVSGVVNRDTDSIMSGLLNLPDLPIKDGYRATVSSELARRSKEALESGDIYGVMRASAGYDKEPSDTFLQSMEKTLAVVSQIGSLQNNLSTDTYVDDKGLTQKLGTGPIMGALRSANPWDTQAQTIKAQLNAIVPNLARGVYGEVGVLTDNDIKQYSKTLPTLTSTDEIRNAILYITLDQIRKNVEIKIRNQANGQRDMSGYADTYKNLVEEVESILSTLPKKTVKIGDKDIQIGSTITNKDGKKATVNADGTVTPL